MTGISKEFEQVYASSTPAQMPNPLITSYDQIRKNYKTNDYKRWLDTADDPLSAQRRFGDEFFYVNSTPKFRLKRSDKFFAIGSCFARNIERELAAEKIMVLTEGTNIPSEFYTAERDARAAMNKFNIPSMIDEVERTFNADFREEGRYIDLGGNEYFDPATSGLKLLSLEDHAKVRAAIRETTLRMAQADAVIITLGLVEAWFDRQSGLFLNTSPHPRAMQQENRRTLRGVGSGADNRFVHMRPNFAYLRDKMHQLIHSIATHAPQARIIISVSPVPLQATMTSDDVVVSSSLSKSLLRVVAEDARDSFEHVDYFPPYEMVMNSPRHLTWEKDQIHVKASLVSQVTSSFVARWID